MSRTYKDRPWQIKFPKEDDYSGPIPYESIYPYTRDDEEFNVRWYSVKLPGIKTKKPKHKNTEWHWLGGTPGWWIHMFMTKPQRITGKQWERMIVREPLDQVLNDYFDQPMVGRRPHKYFW